MSVEEDTWTPEQRERMCRVALEPHGLTVKRFWIDEEGWGHAEAYDHKGRVFNFTQKRKQGTKAND